MIFNIAHKLYSYDNDENKRYYLSAYPRRGFFFLLVVYLIIFVYYCLMNFPLFFFCGLKIKQMMNSHGESSVDPWETCDLLDCKEGKAKKNWKKVKWHLVEYQKLPLYLKDNEYIVGYYRSEWPLKQILLSIFSIHNETLNVWTYGFFFLLAFNFDYNFCLQNAHCQS